MPVSTLTKSGRTFPVDFGAKTLSKEEPAVQIARRAGVSEQTLYRWKDEFISGGKAQLGGRGVEGHHEREFERLRKELAERDQVIGEITVANRILKKVSGGLS